MREDLINRLSTKDKDIAPTPASYEDILVKFTLDSVFKAFTEDLMCKIDSDDRGHRLNEIVKLTSDEAEYYMRYILVQRIKFVNGVRGLNLTLLKELMVPAFFSQALEKIGIYADEKTGFTFIPETDDDEDFDESRIADIGSKFAKLKDVYASAQGAWFPSKAGNPDVMRMACIREEVYSMAESAHPIYQYLAAFLDAKIAEEIELRGLYRFKYNAISTILHIMQTEGMDLC
jgi:hypothetical protein